MVGGKLGLVVTTYNATRSCASFSSWLEACQSVFHSIAIVDDCSDDGSYEYLVSRLKDLVKVKFIRCDINSGRPSIPRNIGMKEISRVDRLVFLDVDDVLTKDYLAFLASPTVVLSQDVYSGVKVPSTTGLFDLNYQSDFSKERRISKAQLSRKNQVVFSGSSIPSRLISRHQFKNCPLEDWLFWRDISSDSAFTGQIVRLLDVPVGYDVSPSLSPGKYKQVARISKHLSGAQFFQYFAETFRLKAEESSIRRRIVRNHTPLNLP